MTKMLSEVSYKLCFLELLGEKCEHRLCMNRMQRRKEWEKGSYQEKTQPKEFWMALLGWAHSTEMIFLMTFVSVRTWTRLAGDSPGDSPVKKRIVSFLKIPFPSGGWEVQDPIPGSSFFGQAFSWRNPVPYLVPYLLAEHRSLVCNEGYREDQTMWAQDSHGTSLELRCFTAD